MTTFRVRKFTAAVSLLGAGFLSGLAAQGQARGNPGAPEPADQPHMLETVVVTGSNLPPADGAAAAPVTVLGRQQIENTGAADVLAVLRKALPQFSGNNTIGSENANLHFGRTYGGSSLALHNLSTLVLIDGRRVAVSPAGASGGADFVDVNLIPLAAVDRIEVMSDGASAIYGSSAVGGVVNIILKSDYRGFEVSGHYGVTDNAGGYAERSASLVGGVADGTTSITVSVQAGESDPIYQYQRGYSRHPKAQTTYYPGVIDIYDFATGGDLLYRLKPGLNAPPAGGNATIDDLIARGIYAPATLTEVQNAFSVADAVTLVMRQKRRGATVRFDRKLFGDGLTLFGDLVYANTRSESQLNAPPLYPSLSTPYIDRGLTGATPLPATGVGSGYVLATSANSPFSPAWIDQGAPADYSAGKWVSVHNRFTDYPRRYQNDTTLWRGVAGMRGRTGGDYAWETAANLNRIVLDYRNPGVIDLAALTDAMNAGAINPFARTQTAGALPGALVGTAFARYASTLHSFDAKLTGAPWALPAGKLAFAVGGEYSRETLSAAPDARSIPAADGTIGWAGASSISPFAARRSIEAGYLELRIPLVAPALAVPGINTLDIDVAGRVEHYSDAGAARVPKISLRYQPFDRQLTLRATAGQSFSAPQLFNVYGPSSQGFTGNLVFDNYGGGTTENVEFQKRVGSNPDLAPAKAHTWTAGLVYSPAQAPGLDLSFDWYDVDETGRPGVFDEQVVAQDVELRGAASPYASYVHLGGWGGSAITAPGQLSSTAAASVFLDLPVINLARQRVRGFDATLHYATATAAAGRFDFASTVVGYERYRVQTLPTEPAYDYAGRASGGGSGSPGTIPRWRTHATLDWKYREFECLLAGTYVPAVVDVGPGGGAAAAPVKVAAYSTFDVAASWHFVRGWLNRCQLTVGISNLFNAMPPLAANAFPESNVDLGAYDAIGRLFYLNARYKF
jgi:iron complex outermembrane receptor protein